jgi:hypothetical protein
VNGLENDYLPCYLSHDVTLNVTSSVNGELSTNRVVYPMKNDWLVERTNYHVVYHMKSDWLGE